MKNQITKPPIGLMPKKIHDEKVEMNRYIEVCSTIERYFNSDLKINIEWIEEYNELVERVGHHFKNDNPN